jgi:hypothetical protein
VSEICSDPQGHLYKLTPAQLSVCDNCGRTAKYDDLTKTFEVIKE